jgi:hypothetical protein
MNRLCLCLAVLLVFGTCSVTVNRSDLVGTWKAKEHRYIAVLVLNEDGTFRLTYFQGAVTDAASSGTWSLEKEGRRSYILLQHMSRDGDKAAPRGVSSHTISSRWGKLVLDDDPDQDVFYTKAEP